MRREHALVAGIGISVIATALVFWSMRAPSSSYAPSSERSAAPGVAAAPGPSPLLPPAAPRPLPPSASAAALPPELVLPHAGSSASNSGTSPAPSDQAVTRKPVAARKPAPESLAGAAPGAVTAFVRSAAAARPPAANAPKLPRTQATRAREGVATFAAPPAPPARSTTEDLLDLFGDTK